MSWSIGVGPVTSTDEFVEKADEAFAANYATPADGVREQFETARDAVVDVLASEAFGEGPWSVSFYGHARQGDTDGDSFGCSVSTLLNTG